MFGQKVRYHQTNPSDPDLVGFVTRDAGGGVVDIAAIKTGFGNASLVFRENKSPGTGPGQYEII